MVLALPNNLRVERVLNVDLKSQALILFTLQLKRNPYTSSRIEMIGGFFFKKYEISFGFSEK